MKIIIGILSLLLIIPITVFAENNPYEITVSLNKEFVEKNEKIIVTGNVKNFNADFKNLIRILETADGHRVDYDTAPIKQDNTFEFFWYTGETYDSTWGNSGPYIIKINYAGKENWKELEFVYCDKNQQKSSSYLEHCQEAFGYVDVGTITELKNSESKQEPSTITQDGMELEYKGKDPTGSNLWVESDESYNQRIIYPLIIGIIVVVIVIIIVIIIYKVVKSRK